MATETHELWPGRRPGSPERRDELACHAVAAKAGLVPLGLRQLKERRFSNRRTLRYVGDDKSPLLDLAPDYLSASSTFEPMRPADLGGHRPPLQWRDELVSSHDFFLRPISWTRLAFS